MITSVQSWLQKEKIRLRHWLTLPWVAQLARLTVHFLAGLGLSAASIANYCMPFALGLSCVCGGSRAVAVLLGSALGYRLFWGDGCYIGLSWLLAALPVSLLLAEKSLCRRTPLLLPAVAALIVSATGVLFQLALWDQPPIGVYLLRVALAGGSAALFSGLLRDRNPVLDWLAGGVLVLSLAQIVPIPYCGLGYFAAGLITGAGSFPAAAIAGLALDVARVTQVPMTAALCLGYLIRLLPRYPKWLAAVAPTVMYVALMSLRGVWDLQPVLGLAVGSMVGSFLPGRGGFTHRRGETGVAQVRLELAAEVLTQTENLLLEAESPQVDEEALMARCAERACGGCAYRKSCRDSARLQQLPPIALHKPLLSVEELPIICRKPGRYLAELHRGQEQLRSIQADRERQREYRAAVIQQYRFLAEFLHGLADQLPRRPEQAVRLYTPQVRVYGNRAQGENGDDCVWFAGVGKRYYVLLCDGMGKGLGAVEESRTAAQLLRRMLSAGYPAQHALRSMNSLCALRDRAGAVTVDLAELLLDTGRVTLYKWGAPPSFVAAKYGAQKLGVTGPPPGIFVTQEQERVEHTSLRRGEWLVMASDGIGQREAMRCCTELWDTSPGDLASAILTCGQLGDQDDATVVVVSLAGK